MTGLSTARNSYEYTLLNNIQSGARANEKLVQAMSAQSVYQREALSTLVASQERAAGGISELTVIMAQMSATTGALLSQVSSELADVAYQQRLTVDALRQILEAIQAPLDTRAKELRRRAEEAYRNGWIDDARTDFLESEQLNRYDFTVHHALGTIAFFHKKDLKTAQQQFGLAAQYARPKSPVDTAYALVAGSSVEELLGNLKQALALSEDAVGAGSNSCPEAYYARGRYALATGGDRASACADLETAFWGNPVLALMSVRDTLLAKHPAERDSALDAFRSGLAEHTAQRIDALRSLRSALAAVGFDEAPDVYAPVVESLDAAVSEIERLEARNSIADYLDALKRASDTRRATYDSARSWASTTAGQLRESAERLEREHRERVHKVTEETKWARGGCAQSILVGLLVVAMAVGVGMLLTAADPLTDLLIVMAVMLGGIPAFWVAAVVAESILSGHANRRVRDVSDRVDPRIEVLNVTAASVEQSVPQLPSPAPRPVSAPSPAPRPSAVQPTIRAAAPSPAPQPTAAPAPAEVRAEAPAPAVVQRQPERAPDMRPVIDALRNRSRLAGIRAYREATGVGLVEAKEAVDRIAQERGIRPPS